MSKSSKHLRILLLVSLFSALSIVFGKLLAFNLGETIRISFESLPILLAGIFLGPIHGMLVGVVADLLGCLIVGYAINPIITAGAAVIGLSSGLLFYATKPFPTAVRIFISVLSAHVLGSILIKTVGLILYYGSPHTLFWIRSYYLAIAVIEGAIIFALAKSQVVHALDKLIGRKGQKSS